LKFKQLHSGSSGNLYTLTASNGKRLLIEAGVVWSKLQKSLDFDLSGFEGCVISHAHEDHSKSMQRVMQSMDVYASTHTFESQDLLNHHRSKVISSGDTRSIGSFQVFAFEAYHDVPTLGFVIYCDGEYLLFVTDSSHITHKFNYPFSIIAIECSFDKAILTKRVADKDIHESLAKRLWNSHMEKSNTLAYIRDKCNLEKCREIHLLHMSGDNLDKNKTQEEFYNELFISTIKVGDK